MTAQEGEAGRTAHDEKLQKVMTQDGADSTAYPIIPGSFVRSMSWNRTWRAEIRTPPRFQPHDLKSFPWPASLPSQSHRRARPHTLWNPIQRFSTGFMPTRSRMSSTFPARAQPHDFAILPTRNAGKCVGCAKEVRSMQPDRSRGQCRLPGFSPTGKRPITTHSR